MILAGLLFICANPVDALKRYRTA